MIRRLVLILVALCCAHGIAWTQVPAPSTWVNQRGSILTISSIDSKGTLTGTFINKASGFGCQNVSYPMTGSSSGADINFAVTWNNVATWDEKVNCQSVTVWQGTLRGNTISSQWQLAYGDTKSGRIQIYSGPDIFTKQ